MLATLADFIQSGSSSCKYLDTSGSCFGATIFHSFEVMTIVATKNQTPAAVQEVQHYGMADASSAIAIGADKFLVVSDEKNVFQLYHRDQSGPSIDETSFASFIHIDNKKLEGDIEGSATIADTTYWIGSHSRDKNGGLARNRHQFFATLIKDKADHVVIKQLGNSYTGLLFDLLSNTEFRKLTNEDLAPEPDLSKSSKEPGAISIEGLTAWNNSLLIGFRNPIPNDQAVLVPLLNPLEIVLNGSHAEFGEFLYFDLGGRGIRSMDYWPDRQIFVIVAGAFNQKDDFAYYSWTGNSDDQPTQLHLDGIQDLNTEALVFFDGEANHLLAISDDGGQFKGQKHEKSELCFRSKWLST